MRTPKLIAILAALPLAAACDDGTIPLGEDETELDQFDHELPAFVEHYQIDPVPAMPDHALAVVPDDLRMFDYRVHRDHAWADVPAGLVLEQRIPTADHLPPLPDDPVALGLTGVPRTDPRFGLDHAPVLDVELDGLAAAVAPAPRTHVAPLPGDPVDRPLGVARHPRDHAPNLEPMVPTLDPTTLGLRARARAEWLRAAHLVK